MMSGIAFHREDSKGAMSLFLFLIGSAMLGFGVATLQLRGVAKVGLGWALHPGPIILVAIAAMLWIGYRRKVPKKSLLFVAVTFVAPMVVEFLPVLMSLRAFLGIPLILLGCAAVWGERSRGPFWVAGLFAVSVYLNAILIYNLFAGVQVMNFFLAGWTS